MLSDTMKEYERAVVLGSTLDRVNLSADPDNFARRSGSLSWLEPVFGTGSL